MYTELNFAVVLKKNTPGCVIEAIQSMIDGDGTYNEMPDHPFFNTDRWRHLFLSDSYYFDGDMHSSFRFDKISNQYVLTVRSNLKNYCFEIEMFLNFLCPYMDTYGFIGYERYEEFDDPSLIYNENGVVYIGKTAIDSDYVAAAKERIETPSSWFQ